VSQVPSTPGDPRATERLTPDAAGLARAAALLRSGGLVAFPTETVYGLGADAGNARAVAALYAAKRRPSFNPLIAHVPDADAARRVGRFSADANMLAEAFWPGPLTLVVPMREGEAVVDLARAGLPSVALRVPSHPVALALLADLGRPVVAPSANLSGRVSPTTTDHVAADLDGRIDAILDAGPAAVGLESTIVACLGDEPRLLRPGGISREALEEALGRPLGNGLDGGADPLAPGALASHYAPRARLRLDAVAIEPQEAVLLFGSSWPPGIAAAASRLNLSPGADLAEAASNLFGYLRHLDATRAAAIAVTPIPASGLGEAINDRLRRAASGR
jgi:L-threonylcarbamoyladenylate synthase